MPEIKQFVPIHGTEVVPVEQLCGWGVWNSPTEFDYQATKQVQREDFDLWGDGDPIYARLNVVGAGPWQAGQRSMLWEVGRKLMGTDPLNYPQLIGDCVSFGAKNAIEHVQFFPLANGQRINWTMVFTPYLYGTGRVLVGGGRLGREDGSIGAWQAKAVMQYGTIPLKYEGLPPYSGGLARQWGVSPGPPSQWVDLGKHYLVKSAAAVMSWEDVVTALVNGYPITIASNVGFDMTPRQDGFHHYSTSWGHQMCIIGVDDDPGDPYACILNSWGDLHGQVKDFKTGEIWPKGTLRVRKKDILSILAEKDSFAYSSFDGFPAQNVDRDKFDLW